MQVISINTQTWHLKPYLKVHPSNVFVPSEPSSVGWLKVFPFFYLFYFKIRWFTLFSFFSLSIFIHREPIRAFIVSLLHSYVSIHTSKAKHVIQSKEPVLGQFPIINATQTKIGTVAHWLTATNDSVKSTDW